MSYKINEFDTPGILYYNDKMSINYNAVHKFEEENSVGISEDRITKDFPVFDYFIAKDKQVKFISGGLIPRSILFREDLQVELLKFDLPKHLILDIKFVYRKKWIEDYKVLFLEEDMIKYADFGESVFLADDLSLPYGTDRSFEFTVKSLNELIEFGKDIRYNFRSIKSLVLNTDFPKYDLFRFNIINFRFYCSDRMKEWFLQNDDVSWPFKFYQPEFPVYLSDGTQVG